MTTIKRIPRETRIAYETCRAMAVERASRLAESLGVDTLPLDVVAPMLPTAPEWSVFRAGPRVERV